jgi:6-phospho-beta-glucosidase
MRLVILGGGGFRVPLVYRSVATGDVGGAATASAGGPRVDEVVLHDRDPQRLARIAAVLRGMAEREALPGGGPRLRITTDLSAALAGADFVFSAIRVGGLTGRVCDERAAMAQGLLGQETTGAGGVCYALRTVPAALTIAQAVRRHAPNAFVINFTNPAGLVTEAMAAELGDRVVGVCDSPVGLFRRVARALDVPVDGAWFDYAGLNHLGWLRRVVVHGDDLLPGLLADDRRLQQVEEGRLFGADWLRGLGAVPNEYLYYWYFHADAAAAAAAADQTRGEFLRDQQSVLFAGTGPMEQASAAYDAWEATRRDREATYMADTRDVSGAGARDAEDLDGGGYDGVALRLMGALAADRPTTLVLNVRNGTALPGLDADAVVEVPCLVDGRGVRPLATGALDGGALAKVVAVKHVERLAIRAARDGSQALAVQALAEHPLVDSVSRARAILDTQLAELPDLAAVFAHR